jgi:hypothetical protein
LRENSFPAEKRPPGLKPVLIQRDLRGPEGPLFHGDRHIHYFFRKLYSDAGKGPNYQSPV